MTKKLLITFDTELGWGINKGKRYNALNNSRDSGRKEIKYLIDKLDKFGIKATWGVVGHLLLDQCSADTHVSNYRTRSLDPYTNSKKDPLYYAPEIINWIIDSQVEHEIAAHSFSHPRFSALTSEQAYKELIETRKVFQSKGLTVDSFIYPYNDIDHVDLLSEVGFSAYCTGVQAGPQTLRAGIKPFILGGVPFWETPLVQPYVDEHGLLVFPRSRQLKDKRWGWLNYRRFCNTLNKDQKGYIHLTLHPHNLLYDPHLKRTLPRLLEKISEEKQRGEIQIATINEVFKEMK